jgi:hypothetical protein
MRWKTFSGSNPEWSSRGLRGATVGRHFGEAAVPEAECGPCPVFEL